MEFVKMHGTGNDYVYVDLWTESVSDPVTTAIEVSHRHFGIGADGLILVAKPTEPGFAGRMVMYNADGSESGMCGNGLRCVAKFLFDRGRTGGEKEFRLQTGAGPRGMATAPGFSSTMGLISSTSNTRSKETRVVNTSTFMFERAVNGPYRRAR